MLHQTADERFARRVEGCQTCRKTESVVLIRAFFIPADGKTQLKTSSVHKIFCSAVTSRRRTVARRKRNASLVDISSKSETDEKSEALTSAQFTGISLVDVFQLQKHAARKSFH
jgi:hypothetical protein